MSQIASTIGDSDPFAARMPTHCVFRSGSSWQALPATSVREVMPRPDMISIPGTPATFVGMCHVRSEFIPVLNLSRLLAEGEGAENWSFEADSEITDTREAAMTSPALVKGQILLVLDDKDGVWAVLVDEVIALQRLDVSNAPEDDHLNSLHAVAGWATADGVVIQILDQDRIRALAEHDLSVLWQSVSQAV